MPGQGRGKNNVQFYTDSLATQSARRFELETALRQAIARQAVAALPTQGGRHQWPVAGAGGPAALEFGRLRAP